MASSQHRPVHQDYIARVRYSSQLPPPPFPPKLLEIPGTGLADSSYTSASYASRLTREQPLNIEADAELGMPIDLIGIPGIFDGDERAITTRPNPQPLHPADKALLRPLNSLSKGSAASGAVSFLRRTEYTSSQATQHFTSSTSKDLTRLRNDPKKRKAAVNKEDPINIMRNIIKGFDVAYPRDAYKGEDNTTNLRGAPVSEAELKEWQHPRHPERSDLKLLDTYPVLPDLDAIPTTGFYIIMKFQGNPIPQSGAYDKRLDTAILKPVADELSEAAYEERMAAWNESDKSKPEPIPEYDYDYFLPADASAVRGIKRKLDVNDVENDDPELYTDDVDGQGCFKYHRLRTYETHRQDGDPSEFYNDSVAMALHDPETDAGTTEKRLQKAAYFYPIVQRTGLRPKRNVGKQPYQQEEMKIDELNVTVANTPDEYVEKQLEKQAQLDPKGQSNEVAV